MYYNTLCHKNMFYRLKITESTLYTGIERVQREGGRGNKKIWNISLLFFALWFPASFDHRSLSGQKFLCRNFKKYFFSELICHKRNDENLIGEITYPVTEIDRWIDK